MKEQAVAEERQILSGRAAGRQSGRVKAVSVREASLKKN